MFPEEGSPGVQVMIEGSSFCQQPQDDEDPSCANVGTVMFDQQPAEVLEYTDTSILVRVPEHDPGPVRVVVLVIGRTSDGAGFLVTP